MSQPDRSSSTPPPGFTPPATTPASALRAASALTPATAPRPAAGPAAAAEPAVVIDFGTAGASARREHQRRQANRRGRAEQRYGKLIAGALDRKAPPQHEQAWAKGAVGEERVAAALAKRCPGVVVLHDRGIPGSRANIDHIAVTATEVWIIDAKRYYRSKVAVAKPLFRPAKLRIGGSDKTKLVTGVQGQVDLVRAVVDEVRPGTTVRGAMCFVDADIPRRGLSPVAGVALLHPRLLVKRLGGKKGTPSAEQMALAAALAERFPAA